MMGVQDAATRALIVDTSSTKRSTDFVALLDLIDRRYGPASQRDRPVALVLDNGPFHTSKFTTKALAEQPWLIIVWLPKCAPALNDIERSWSDVKQHHLAHQTFADAGELEQTIQRSVADLNKKRIKPHPCDKLRITA